MEDALHTAIEALERAVQSRRAELTMMERSLEQLRGSAPDMVSEPHSLEWQGMGITEAAMKWLAEVNEPRSTREIADAIRSKGVKTSSRNYTATVYATLSNARTKFSRKDGLWTVIPPKHGKKV